MDWGICGGDGTLLSGGYSPPLGFIIPFTVYSIRRLMDRIRSKHHGRDIITVDRWMTCKRQPLTEQMQLHTRQTCVLGFIFETIFRLSRNLHPVHLCALAWHIVSLSYPQSLTRLASACTKARQLPAYELETYLSDRVHFVACVVKLLPS